MSSIVLSPRLVYPGRFCQSFLLEGIGLCEAKAHGQSWLENCLRVWLGGGGDDYMETFHFGVEEDI